MFNEIERDGIAGPMKFWGVGQNVDATVILHPLRRLHDISRSWVKHLERNTCEARHSRVRAILADSGALKPKVHVFRSQF